MKYALLLALAIFSARVSAQCTEVFFYRVNGALAGASPVYLLYDGVPIAQVELGQRYRMELCDAGDYEFVVRTDPTDVISDRQVVPGGTGESVFLRVGLTPGVEVVSLRNMGADKGQKDLDRSAKFVGAMQDLSLNSTVLVSSPASGGSGMGGGGQATPAGGQSSMEPVTINNFRFDLTDVRKSGELVEMDFKITNLAGNDRQMSLCNRMLSFYDENGQLYFVDKVCLANNCNRSTVSETTVSAEYNCIAYNYAAQAMMPSGIPLNASFTFNKVDRNAKQFIRGDVWFEAEQPVQFRYGAIPFPGSVAADNPNKKIAGRQSYTYLNSFRRGEQVYTRFVVDNSGISPYALQVESAKAYDDQGLPHDVAGLSFGNHQQANFVQPGRSGWSESIPASRQLEFFLVFDGVPRQAKTLPRVDVDFGNFELRWSDIQIGDSDDVEQNSGPATAAVAAGGPSGDEYITYERFKSDAPEKRKIVGKRVILDNIYFDSGSDKLLSTSFPQLDDLAATLAQNAELAIEISGHTDNVGAQGANVLLSQKRADAVRYYLIEHAVPPAQMKSTGYGDSRSIDDNDTPAGRQHNRRVEVRVLE